PVVREVPKPSDDPASPNHFGSLLIIITTNQERDLPAAFLRRCVVHTIQEPTTEADQVARMKAIAMLHLRTLIGDDESKLNLAARVAVKCWQLRESAKRKMRRGPSTAEFLDALRVCLRLNIDPEGDLWQQVERGVLLKDEGSLAQS